MKKIVPIIFIFISSICYGQANKTLKDSVFKKGDVLKIPEIFYDIGVPCCSRADQIDSLKPVGIFLSNHKNLIVEIACYTDSRGNMEANLKTSDFRAESVWEYLIYEYKLDENFVKFKGYGESKLIINDYEIEKAKTQEEKRAVAPNK